MDNRYNILFLLCQETWNCGRSEGTRIAILWGNNEQISLLQNENSAEKMEIKNVSMIALVGAEAWHASWRRTWRGYVALQQLFAVENSHCSRLQKERAS